MMHEVGNQANFLREIYRMLKPGAAFLLTEPIKHVSRAEFDRTVSLAQQKGFVVTDHPLIRLSRTVVLKKPSP
jgi:ubiquinone/menaquinone biosynthesis C-methylase UbiE